MKMNIKKTDTIVTQLKAVDRFEFKSKNGTKAVIVSLKTADGNFTNYLNIWEAQHINLDEVEEGDSIEVSYAIYHDAAKNKDYKNFLSVRVL